MGLGGAAGWALLPPYRWRIRERPVRPSSMAGAAGPGAGLPLSQSSHRGLRRWRQGRRVLHPRTQKIDWEHDDAAAS
jgi:hypothetical protein